MTDPTCAEFIGLSAAGPDSATTFLTGLGRLAVLGVPIESKTLKGIDSLLSIVQMPAGIPVATFAMGVAGVTNAGLAAGAILANKRPEIDAALKKFRAEQTAKVLSNPDPSKLP